VLEASDFYDIPVIVAGLVVAFVLITLPAIRLLARTVYRHRPLGRVRALVKVLRFLTFGIGRKAIYLAACRWIEAELLNPRPPRPDRFESGTRREHRKAREQYRADKREWTRQAWERLADLMSVSSQTPKLLKVSTCFELYRAEEGIRRYFDARVAGKPTIDIEPTSFQSRIRVSDGFVAPLFLLGGLIAHFEEDWRPVIEDYGRTMRGAGDPLGTDIRSLQAFLFTCWLLWGPSIPMGTCPRWTGRSLLQFGYGDENNSIAVLESVGATRQASPYPFAGRRNGGYGTLANHVEVVGMIKRVSREDTESLCDAQRTQYQEDTSPLILQATEPIAERPSVSAYYSAYVWVIFVICDSTGKPLPGKEKWRNMLTFFEHGNLAEEYTFEVLKRQLANKARSSVELVLAADPGITLRYACATDDCGCGSPAACPPPPNESIREILTQYRPGGRFAEFEKAGRVTLTPLPTADRDYAACSLPKVVKEFTDTMADEARQADRHRLTSAAGR
jgi:hypothetical protein